MQRLVYAPRVYAFIKNDQDEIQDISDYITAGQVVRKVNAVSTASLTLRNPNKIFTIPNQTGQTAFTPMDPITIFLKRLPGRPVRVFTGFLDKVPYFQMYPGTVTLQASCTLKRLLYTYFDPALPYTQSFLAAYGWINKDGMVFNLNGLNEFKGGAYDPANPGKTVSSNLDQGTLINGSLGQLLFATLKHIGHWAPDDIYIEALPDDLFVHLAEIAAEFQADSELAKTELKELLKSVVGEGSHGGADQGGPTNSSIDLSGIDGTVAEQVYKVGVRMKVSQKFLLAAMVTGLDESGMTNIDHGTGTSVGWRQETADSYPGVDRMDVPASAERFYNECKKMDSGQAADVLAYDVQRPSGHPDPSKNPYTKFRSQGATLLNKLRDGSITKDGTTTDAGTSLQTGVDLSLGQEYSTPDSSSRSTSKGGTNKSSNSDSNTKLTSPVKGVDVAGIGVGGGAYGAPRGYPGGHAGVDIPSALGATWYSITDGVVVAVSNSWTEGTGCVVIRSTQKVANYPASLRLGYGGTQSISVKVGDEVKAGDAIATGGSHGSGPHLHFFVRTDDLASNGSMDPTALAKAAAKGEQPSGGPGSGGGGSSSSSSSNTTGGEAFSGASALAAVLDLPSAAESWEAVALQGEKSLMNDKPLLPFIQQMTDASLRQFQSLPDGSFFAFYPDYFGELYHRAPYWEIDDIEVLDGGVDLSDDSVVTHYYAIGDTTWPASLEQANRVFSAGTITIFNAFMAGDSIIDQRNIEAQDKKAPKLLEKEQALRFLRRYGARPVVEDMPMIHSPYFEMFLAYQRFMLAWSKQFSTPFTFTFMPELFPGGKVGFPAHGLQMYIEEVTHTFDYTTGFMTEAQMSAPSVYKGQNTPPSATTDLPPNMVRALIGPPTDKKTKKTPGTWSAATRLPGETSAPTSDNIPGGG